MKKFIDNENKIFMASLKILINSGANDSKKKEITLWERLPSSLWTARPDTKIYTAIMARLFN